MPDKLSVGVLDSGAGGLTVVAELLASDRQVEIHYFADHAFSPYGSLTVSDMRQRLMAICHFLIAKGISVLVIACNTATLEAISTIRNLSIIKDNNIVVVGVEPAVKPAAMLQTQGVISVLATPISCESQRLKSLIESAVSSSCLEGVSPLNYHCIASDVLANAIDALPVSIKLVERELQRIKGLMQELDSYVLVLACTHYPLIKPMFDALFDRPVTIIEPSQAVATRVFSCIDNANLAVRSVNEGEEIYLYSSGDYQDAECLQGWLKVLLDNEQFEGLVFNLNSDCVAT